MRKRSSSDPIESLNLEAIRPVKIAATAQFRMYVRPFGLIRPRTKYSLATLTTTLLNQSIKAHIRQIGVILNVVLPTMDAMLATS